MSELFRIALTSGFCRERVNTRRMMKSWWQLWQISVFYVTLTKLLSPAEDVDGDDDDRRLLTDNRLTDRRTKRGIVVIKKQRFVCSF